MLLCSVKCELDFYEWVHDRCKFGAKQPEEFVVFFLRQNGVLNVTNEQNDVGLNAQGLLTTPWTTRPTKLLINSFNVYS